MSTSIVFETHSITEDNEAGIATGWLPGRLSEEGRRLAVELGERRPGSGFVAVWSSDLARAVETAQLAYAGGDVPLHELSYPKDVQKSIEKPGKSVRLVRIHLEEVFGPVATLYRADDLDDAIAIAESLAPV